MNIRRVHRLLGVALLLPLLAWVATAAVFFIKPGYARAYEMLSVRTLPLRAMPAASLPEGAHEARFLRTAMGEHLLVKTAQGWSHHDPTTLRLRPVPSPQQVRGLISDAIRGNPRYGSIVTLHGLSARTSTGVTINLDWNTLALDQRGPDTDRIDSFYRIHYLQWTGIKVLDRVLGGAGLLLLLALTLFGLRLAFGARS